MKIQYHGETKFTITGKKATVAINHEGKADIYLFSKLQEGRAEAEGTKCFDWPGEYEVKGVSISCLPSKSAVEENLVFYLEIDDIKVTHLGKVHADLNAELKTEIAETDVLMIPVNPENSLDAKKAHELIDEIEPRAVVPMNFTDGSLQEFVKEMGLENVEPQAKYDVSSRSALPLDNTDYAILEQV